MEYLLGFILTVLGVCIFLTFIFVLMTMYYGYKQITLLPKNDKCKWVKYSDELSGEHVTQCGEIFNDATESGNPVTDWVKYCPYCGGKVSLK
jgi:hypothetical protein